MEEEKELCTEQETSGYQPRPKGQVIAARVGLVIFLLILVAYYALMFKG